MALSSSPTFSPPFLLLRLTHIQIRYDARIDINKVKIVPRIVFVDKKWKREQGYCINVTSIYNILTFKTRYLFSTNFIVKTRAERIIIIFQVHRIWTKTDIVLQMLDRSR